MNLIEVVGRKWVGSSFAIPNCVLQVVSAVHLRKMTLVTEGGSMLNMFYSSKFFS